MNDWRTNGDSQAAWQYLCRRFAKRAFFGGTPVLRTGPGGIILRLSRKSSALFGLFFAGTACALEAFMLCITSLGGPDAGSFRVMFSLMAALFCLIGLSLSAWSILRVREISFTPAGTDFVFGTRIRCRRLHLGGVNLIPKVTGDDRPYLPSRRLSLWLADPQGQTGMLLLKQGGNLGDGLKVVDLFRQLAIMAGVDLDPALFEQARTRLGSEIIFPRSCVGRNASYFRSCKLTFNAPDVLRATPGGPGRILYGILLASGICGLAVGTLVNIPIFFRFIPLLWGAVFTTVGALMLSGRIGLPRLNFDRRAGRIFVRPARGERSDWPFQAVVCAQICSGMVECGDGGKSYTTFELNLVLSDPPGERLCVMSHSKEQALRDDARQLSEFLNVPLIDSTRLEVTSPR